jgi:hypothetical protein
MIQKIKNIILIVLIIIVIICIITGVILFINRNKNNEKIKELQGQNSALSKMLTDTETREIELNKEYEKLKKKPIKTVKEFVYLKDDQKNKEYETLYNMFSNLLIITDKYKKLAQENADIAFKFKNLYEEAIKLADNNINWGIDLFAFGGLNSKFKPELFAGLTVSKYFNLHLLYVGIGGGGYVNIYRESNPDLKNFDGGGLILQGSLLFKKFR